MLVGWRVEQGERSLVKGFSASSSCCRSLKSNHPPSSLKSGRRTTVFGDFHSKRNFRIHNGIRKLRRLVAVVVIASSSRVTRKRTFGDKAGFDYRARRFFVCSNGYPDRNLSSCDLRGVAIK